MPKPSPSSPIPELVRRVDRLLRIVKLINRMYEAKTAAEIAECEQQNQAAQQEEGLK